MIFIRNQFDFPSLRAVRYANEKENTPLVSILIPARNEVDNIEKAIRCSLEQDYIYTEVIVLDDQSTDGTREKVQDMAREYDKLRYESGIEKPSDWLGKPWACHQLSKKATGDLFLFVDADVWFEPTTVSKVVSEMKFADMLTVWPEQKVVSFWEKMIIPMIYHTLFTLLPAKYVERDPRWMPGKLRSIFSEQFAAACGQFIAINRKAYEVIGGHRAVKARIVEDVELAKAAKRNKLKLRMYHGAAQIHCRMYTSQREIWNGLRKNFFIGFDKNVLLFLFMALLHIAVFMVPFFTIPYAFITGKYFMLWVSVICVLLILMQRWLLDYKFSWNPVISLLHPVSVFWFQLLGLRCLTDHFTGMKATWKGREVSE
ncbi:glycosyltransferase [Balneola sp. MJW-20]|uniref:glycosyltransferase n=1 Tax=Gracilimonas aurantiaca TaxID=3234185 RepID=UPI003465188C